MNQFYATMALTYFVAATVALMALAILLLASAVWEIIVAVWALTDVVEVVLDSIGLLIIGFAVVETAKFIAEEEILRRRELRSPAYRPLFAWHPLNHCRGARGEAVRSVHRSRPER